jgi:hypothetical protein
MVGGRLESLSNRLKSPSQELEAQAWGLEREIVSLHSQLLGSPLELGGPVLISHDCARDRTDQQRARVARAGRVEVCRDGSLGALC